MLIHFSHFCRRQKNYSPARRASPSERAEVQSGNRKGTKSAERRSVVSLRSPQRDMLDQRDLSGKPRNSSPSMEKSPSGSDASRGRSGSEERRSKLLSTLNDLHVLIYLFDW